MNLLTSIFAYAVGGVFAILAYIFVSRMMGGDSSRIDGSDTVDQSEPLSSEIDGTYDAKEWLEIASKRKGPTRIRFQNGENLLINSSMAADNLKGLTLIPADAVDEFVSAMSVSKRQYIMLQSTLAALTSTDESNIEFSAFLGRDTLKTLKQILPRDFYSGIVLRRRRGLQEAIREESNRPIVTEIENFNAKGMDRIIRHSDCLGKRSFNLDIWQDQHGRILCRFSSGSREVSWESWEILNLTPPDGAFDQEGSWIPHGLIDRFKRWVRANQ